MASRTIKALRWWMIGLIMLGAVINYLTRATLGVAAPTVLTDLNITTEEYGWITAAFQLGVMMQPLCGYVLDVIGLKMGFAIFATAWRHNPPSQDPALLPLNKKSLKGFL